MESTSHALGTRDLVADYDQRVALDTQSFPDTGYTRYAVDYDQRVHKLSTNSILTNHLNSEGDSLELEKDQARGRSPLDHAQSHTEDAAI